MKCLLICSCYEEANQRQLDLLAENIDAVVSYIPTGADQVYMGRLPIYALMVEEDRLDDAINLFYLPPDENHICLFACPHCSSARVSETSIDSGFGSGIFSALLTLGLVAMGKLIMLRRVGRKYTCHDCGREYRKRP
jgi:predicted RNA-binding Zn-ribbon protein involved in translation (DUF1610 family)